MPRPLGGGILDSLARDTPSVRLQALYLCPADGQIFLGNGLSRARLVTVGRL